MTDLGGQTDQRELLTGFLDWYRGVAEGKLDGLTRAGAVRVATPTGLTMLGIVKHLTWAERRWFRHFLAGEAPDTGDNEGSFVVTDEDTIASVLDAYRAACAHSRRVVADTPLDAPAQFEHRVYGRVNLAWILVHMIEETARHAGHLDILRELTDGRTGD